MTPSLLIRVYSFSYLNGGIPEDPTGNGGGFVFDCRALPNPGRQVELRCLTGKDQKVRKILESSKEVNRFLENSSRIVLQAAEQYKSRGFSDLMVAFGCTGGRHRSVYCAERLGKSLISAGFEVRVIHLQMEKEDPDYRLSRAMILAAGYGTRLQPLTDSTPKALVQAGGRTMLDWTMEALQKHDFLEITINTHHHASQIHAWMKEAKSLYPSQTISLSDEEEILGTGGGIRQAGRFLHGSSPFLVHNVDIWTNFDLKSAYEAHAPEDMATLLCQQRSSTSYLIVDEKNRMVGLSVKGEDNIVTDAVGKTRYLGFTGIHVCSQKLLESMAETREFSIITAYLNLLKAGETIRILEVEGDWFDMGSPEKLENLEQYLLEHSETQQESKEFSR